MTWREDAPAKRTGAGGKGYNPHRGPDGRFASGGGGRRKPARRKPAPKFNAKPYERKIASLRKQEAKHRQASIDVKARMAALKKKARAAPPAKRPALKRQHEKLAARRTELQAKAEAAKIARLEQAKEMRAARREHAAKRKAETAERRAARAGAGSPVDQARASHAAAVKASQRAKDAVDDLDFDAARKHAQEAEDHRARVKEHIDRAKASGIATNRLETDDGVPLIDDANRAARSAEAAIVFRERDQGNPLSARIAPEPGALRSHEYREISESYAARLSADQRLAISNYSDHTDRILNPALRSSRGNPPDGDLYSGSHAPDDVHAERLEKRRERRAADRDYSTTVHEEMRHLDAAIASHTFTRDVVAYRTLSDPDGSIMKAATPGAVWRDHAYVSTTSDRNFLGDFAKGDPAHRVDVRVTIRKGAKGAPMARLSTFDREKEILLPRGSSFRVTKVVAASGDRPKEIHMETVDGD